MTTVGGMVIFLAAIISATVAVSLGHIDSQTYSTILGAALGFGGGVGAHASGVKQGSGGNGNAAGS